MEKIITNLEKIRSEIIEIATPKQDQILDCVNLVKKFITILEENNLRTFEMKCTLQKLMDYLESTEGQNFEFNSLYTDFIDDFTDDSFQSIKFLKMIING